MANYRLFWRIAMLFLLAALLLYAASFLYHSFNIARTRGEVNYAETTWLFAALRVRHGLMPYFDYSHAPYIPMVYAPLLPALTGWLGALFGISDQQTITLTRLFSLGSTFAIALLITVLCRLFRVGLIQSVIAGLFFLTPSVTFQLWSVAARSDMLAVVICMSAIAVVCFTIRSQSTPLWTLLVSGILCGLAVAAKQTALAPLIALGLWIALGGAGTRSWLARSSQLAIIAFGAVVGFGAIIAPFGVDGARLLWQGTLDLATHPLAAGDFYSRLDEFVRLLGLCLPLCVLGAWTMFSSKAAYLKATENNRALQLFLTYAVTSTLVFLATIAKLGSASSYAMELIAVLCVMLGVGLSSVTELLGRISEREFGAALLVLALVPVGVQSWYAFKTAQLTQELAGNDSALADLAQVNKGPVLSENGYILLHGTDPPYLLDPLFFSVQESLGEWDASPVEQMVEEKKFASVVLFNSLESRASVNGIPWLPDGLYDSVARNYALAGTSGRYYVYLPRTP